MRAEAQEYPTRTVTIVVPLAAGTGMDTIVRIYAEELAKALGKPVVVENQPGAALMLALQNVARAAPDGHTLVVSTSPLMAVNPTLYKKVHYDPEKDFVPLALYTQSPFVLITNPGFGAESMKDFIKKAQDGRARHLRHHRRRDPAILTMETLKRDQVSEQPRALSQSAADRDGRRRWPRVPPSRRPVRRSPLILEGKVKALGITASTRHPPLPQVPTIAEALWDPRLRGRLLARAAGAGVLHPGRPVERLHAEMSRITADKAFQKRVTEIGLMPLDPRPIADISST